MKSHSVRQRQIEAHSNYDENHNANDYFAAQTDPYAPAEKNLIQYEQKGNRYEYLRALPQFVSHLCAMLVPADNWIYCWDVPSLDTIKTEQHHNSSKI